MVLLLISPLSCLHAVTPLFDNPRLPVGAGPRAVILADLDGDGYAEIVTADERDGTVTVWRGGGDGAFSKPVHYPAGVQPVALVAADPDGDGHVDLVVADAGAGAVVVLRNLGGGRLGAPSSFPAGGRPVALVAATIDGDETIDVVVALEDRAGIAVLPGHGDGAFGRPIPHETGPQPSALALGDLDRDGRTDLVVAHRGNGMISVLLNKATGRWGEPRRYPVGQLPSALVVARLDGDDMPDVAVATLNSITILHGSGDGALQLLQAETLEASPTSLVAADLDRDGILDLVAANVPEDHATVLVGRGDGTFAAGKPLHSGFAPAGIALGPLDGDLRPDLVIANHGGDNVTILLTAGHGGFPPAQVLSSKQWPVGVAAADLDGDGDPDLVVCMKRETTVSVFLNEGGRFVPRGRYGTGGHCLDIAVGHLNADEHLDVAVPALNHGEVMILIGNGNGTFQVGDPVSTGDPLALAIADLDGDGVNDLAVANGAILDAVRAAGEAANLSEGTVSVFLGTGKGTFRPRPSVAVGKTPRSLALGDVDGDGAVDLVVANAYSHDISVLRNRGDGTLIPAARYPAGTEPTTFVGLWNLDSDDHLDLLACGAVEGQLLIWTGDGAGGFGSPTRHDVGDYPIDVTVGDLDRDGYVDIIVANKFSDDISVLRGGKDGFQPQETYASDFPVGVSLADIDGNGSLDLLVTNEFTDQVVVLRNRTVAPAQR